MNNEEKKYIKLTPFKMQVLQSFPFIDADFDALTNYELLCKVVDYLNTTIDNVDVLNDEVEEYINKFNELKAYIDNYFDNLDVQEEINNKLDELVEDGTLENLIGAYIQPRIDEQNEEIQSFENEQETELNNFKNNINNRLNIQDNMINSVTNDNPLIASSVSDMTDTTKIYVNTTDGKWYYYDGTNWTIGGTYQGTSLDTVNQNKLNTVYSEVLNTYQTPTISGYVNSSGVISTLNNSYRTDYIDLNDYTNIRYKTNCTSTMNEISYYDENKNYISGIVGDLTRVNKNVTPPNGARYVILSYYTYGGLTPYIYLYKENSLLENYNKLNDKLTDYVISDKVLPDENGYITTSGIITNLSNSYHTKLVKVNSNDIIEYQTFLSSQGNEISYYDENQNYISGIAGDQTRNVKYITPIIQASYISMSYYTDNDVPNPYVKVYNKDSLNNILKHFNQPTGNINCLGDSITLGFNNNNISYVNLLHEMGYNVTKYGVSSSSIALQNNKTDSFLERYSSMTDDADIILVMGGTNDFAVKIPLGDFNTRDDYTFYGALRSLIEGLINKYSTKKIFFVTELDRNYTLTGVNFQDYINAIFECCRYYAIPVLDLNLMMGYNSKNANQMTEYIPDGLHPNTKGHKVIADKIDKFIRYTL